jgi:hypothetical protein
MKRISILVCLLLLLAFLNTQVCYANPVSPPSIVILVTNPPPDLKITSDSIYVPGEFGKHTLLETSFYFYNDSHKPLTTVKFTVTTGGKTFIVEAQPKGYISTFTLDLDDQTLKPGKSLSVFFVTTTFKVILTLITEGLLFYLFGFRKKKSWLVFLAINIVTQVALSIWLNILSNPARIYSKNGKIIITEIIVIVVETIALILLTRERSILRTMLFVIAANILSLIAGVYLSSFLAF